MIREPEVENVFDTDKLASDPTNADEVKMDTQKGYGAKDTSGTLYSVNPPVSVAAPKPLSLSSNMDSRSFFPTKISSFTYSNIYPPI